jgi:hypothetical protein
MPSAPAGGARAPTPRRRPKSSSPARRPRSAGRGSAPARLGGSLNPMARRAFSASPGVRRWSPGRARRASPRRAAPRGPGRLAKSLTALLALQGALMGRKANTPYVGAPGKALAIYPLGTTGPNYTAMTRTMGKRHELAKYAVVERARLRRPQTCGRKACLGGQPNISLYEPMKVRSHIYGTKVPRKFGNRHLINLPVPVISAANVLRFEAQGYQFPKSVLKQAHMGLPITANFKPSKRTLEALAAKDPRLLPALFEAAKPLPSRFNRTAQLALPAGVQRKLHALENRARSMAVIGAAKTAAFPYKVAAKARYLTGSAAASVARGASSVARAARYTASLPGRGKRALGRLVGAQGRRLPN